MVDRDDGQSYTNSTRDVWQLIQSFDAPRERLRQRQRNPQILPQKYLKMRKSALAFFRATCHLFYRDLPQNSSLNLAPSTWICGDLHLENFGAYKGDDRQIYFGINDFDEGALAPCLWDVSRLVTSIFLATDLLELDRSGQTKLAQIYLTTYADTLASGSIKAIDTANARGIVGDLLTAVSRRKRRDLLAERTEIDRERRHLKIDGVKILAISDLRRQEIIKTIDTWAQTQAEPEFFQVLDVGFRVAGTGSLGLDRYIILVKGKGSPVGKASPLENRNYLLDFKQQPASALEPYLLTAQPEWKRAARVMKVQQLVQSAPPALLAAIEFSGDSYLLRELQPTEDKIAFKSDKIGLSDLERLIDTMGEVTAYAHLHGSGKLGAAIDRDLVDFGHGLEWQQQVLDYADAYARQVELDYQVFCQDSQKLA
ncbi:DUF2252 family protein [Chamaesiphon sp. OTE_20_metabat_361]|uniref:DUF2252 domain-containing protein n=1 Tax=Chamaesiphon sp. OTE_20_metabat_361 TaxID=2964689 RepID=UPI00286B4EF2|nr:DUF2252 family protein [Chamaesiphon sp. OTE_20_metabat_361]